MIRKLLATTALTAFVATGAFAQQNNTAPATETPAATAPAANAAAVKQDGDHLASNIIGEAVYNGSASDAERIGDVNDLVVGQDGRIKQIVVGVGGFLGIGEKDVALDFDQLKWNDPAASGTAADGTTTAATGDRWLVTSVTKESLEALPAFDRSTFDPAPAATTAMNQNADGSMSTGTMSTGTMAGGTAAGNTAAGGTGEAVPAPATTDNTAMNNNMAATPDGTQTGAIDRSKLTAVTPDKLTADNLIGTTVYGANDANVGSISDIVLDKGGKVDAVLIDVGGFLGIGAKQVAVGMDKLSFMEDANNNRYLYTTLTKDKLEGQAAYNADTYASDRDNQRLTVQ